MDFSVCAYVTKTAAFDGILSLSVYTVSKYFTRTQATPKRPPGPGSLVRPHPRISLSSSAQIAARGSSDRLWRGGAPCSLLQHAGFGSDQQPLFTFPIGSLAFTLQIPLTNSLSQNLVSSDNKRLGYGLGFLSIAHLPGFMAPIDTARGLHTLALRSPRITAPGFGDP